MKTNSRRFLQYIPFKIKAGTVTLARKKITIRREHKAPETCGNYGKVSIVDPKVREALAEKLKSVENAKRWNIDLEY